MQMSRILLPVDGSSYSDHAVEHAVYCAKLSGARVTVISCYEWSGYMLEMPESMVADLKKKYAEEAQQIVEQASKKLEAAGVDYEVKLIAGSPGSELPKLAKSKDYDLIIMGSHGHSDLSGLFLGSVTHKVLNKIYCPVMVVP